MILRAKLINGSNGEPVPYAHIIIVNKKVGISSNIDGDFSIMTSLNDTLKISAIGYENYVYIITEFIDFDQQVIMELIPTVYELETVIITPYLSYAELRKAIVNYKLSEEELHYIQVRNHLKKILKYKEPSGEYGFKIGGPVSLLYSAFSKYAKSQRKFRKFKIEDKRQAIIFRKYNPVIVSHLTGLKDEELVKEFMEFCNLPDEYLLEVKDIDLYMNLLVRYEDFLENLALINPN